MVAQEREKIFFRDKTQVDDEARQRTVLLFLKPEDLTQVFGGDQPSLDQPLPQSYIAVHLEPSTGSYNSKFQGMYKTMIHDRPRDPHACEPKWLAGDRRRIRDLRYQAQLKEEKKKAPG